MKRVLLTVVILALSLLTAGWASDFVTLQGERTIYTLDCLSGSWTEDRCTGKTVAGARYRYRIDQERSEVLVWTVGQSQAIGTLRECVIRDGRNWRCARGFDAGSSVTLQMQNGMPAQATHEASKGHRDTPKWRWWLTKISGGFTPSKQPSSTAASSR